MGEAFAVPERVARTATEMLGQEGEAWLGRLPEVVARCAERWSLTLGAPFPGLSINYVVPGTRADGEQAVLKVCIPGAEFATEAEALRICDGRGVPRLLAADVERGVLLLERLFPGARLSSLPDDRQATGVAAAVMRRLWRPVPEDHPFPMFDDWMTHMIDRAPRLVGPGRPDLARWIDRSAAVYGDLAPSAGDPVLLHGDLHQDNILSAAREPWLAIDPKGVVGAPICETGPLLLNALPPPGESDARRRALVRRVEQLADELRFDHRAVAAWGVVRAVLSGFWLLEDHGYGWEPALATAEDLAALAGQ